MKKTFVSILILFSVLLSGCSMTYNRNLIEGTSLIRIFGIDYKDGTYTLTILYNNNAVSDEEKTFKSLSGEGKTVYEAYEKVKQKSEKFPSLTQIKFIILNAEAAKQGISDIIDFGIRNEQIKTDVQVMLVSKGTAKELIKSNEESDSFLGDTLQTTQHKERKTVEHVDCTLDGIHKHFVTNSESFLVINLEPGDNIYINGYGVFNDGRLVDMIDYDTSMGVDFVLGNVRSAPIYTPDFAAIITDISAKRSVEIENGQITYTIKTKFSTAIRDIISDNFDKSESNLRKEQNAYVNSLITKAFIYIRQTGYDIINVKSLIKATRPSEYQSLKDSFDIKNVDFKMQTFSEVDKTFNTDLMEAK